MEHAKKNEQEHPEVPGYQLIRQLGEGGMGRVFLASPLGSDTRVALKVLHGELAQRPTEVTQLLEATRALQKIKHPNVVGVMEVGTLPDGGPFVVMEYLDGRELSEVIGELEPPRVVEIARQTCAGLSAVHRSGLLHRDLKPSNLFLVRDASGAERVKLLDFGLAHDATDGRGVPEYWSPEQASGGALDQRSDLYSLGVLLHEALAGAPPFRSHSFSDLVQQHLHAAPPLLARSRRGTPIPDWLSRIVQRCLAKDPAARFQSAEELERALVQAGDTLSPGSVTGERPADDDALAPGTTVGDYRIESLLAVGGMATIYAGVHPLIGKKAAIKVISRTLSANAAMVDRFLQEARAVNQIGHPNIVDIFTFGTLPDGRNYLVMEWLQGETLHERLARSRMTARDALTILFQLCDALGAAHENGIVHRDLKPENVFLVALRNNKTMVKLLDFGIAKLVGDSDSPGGRVGRTQAGLVMGTPEYLSPEQAMGKPIDHRCDIYSLGVMAYEMFVGRLPFQGSNAIDLMHQHIHATPPAPDELRADLPPGASALLLRMLAKDPIERPTREQVVAALAAMHNVTKSSTLEEVSAEPLDESANPHDTEQLATGPAAALALTLPVDSSAVAPKPPALVNAVAAPLVTGAAVVATPPLRALEPVVILPPPIEVTGGVATASAPFADAVPSLAALVPGAPPPAVASATPIALAARPASSMRATRWIVAAGVVGLISMAAVRFAPRRAVPASPAPVIAVVAAPIAPPVVAPPPAEVPAPPPAVIPAVMPAVIPAPPPPPAPAKLTVAMTPAAARLEVDGQPVETVHGQLQMTIPPDDRDHSLTVSAPHYLAATKSFRVDPGATVDMAIALEREPKRGKRKTHRAKAVSKKQDYMLKLFPKTH